LVAKRARQAEERLEKKPTARLDKDEEADEGDWLTISEAERISGIKPRHISKGARCRQPKGKWESRSSAAYKR